MGYFVGWAISRCLSSTPHPIGVQGGSTVVWLLVRSSCSSPSTKELHGSTNQPPVSCLKMDQPCLFSFILVFSNKQYNFDNKSMRKISCIRCWDSNPRPLNHELSPITNRPLSLLYCSMLSLDFRVRFVDFSENSSDFVSRFINFSTCQNVTERNKWFADKI